MKILIMAYSFLVLGHGVFAREVPPLSSNEILLALKEAYHVDPAQNGVLIELTNSETNSYCNLILTKEGRLQDVAGTNYVHMVIEGEYRLEWWLALNEKWDHKFKNGQDTKEPSLSYLSLTRIYNRRTEKLKVDFEMVFDDSNLLSFGVKTFEYENIGTLVFPQYTDKFTLRKNASVHCKLDL